MKVRSTDSENVELNELLPIILSNDALEKEFDDIQRTVIGPDIGGNEQSTNNVEIEEASTSKKTSNRKRKEKPRVSTENLSSTCKTYSKFSDVLYFIYCSVRNSLFEQWFLQISDEDAQ